MLRAYDATARYVDQGGNKRPGAFAIYIEPWHAEVFEFLLKRTETGPCSSLRGTGPWRGSHRRILGFV